MEKKTESTTYNGVILRLAIGSGKRPPRNLKVASEHFTPV